GRSVFVGSEPRRIAVSDDGSTAYVGLYGADQITQVNLASFTVSRHIQLPREPEWGARYAMDMLVPPGKANTVVAVLWGAHPMEDGGTWAFRNGQALPMTTEGLVTGGSIEMTPDGTLYSYADMSPSLFVRMSLHDDGIHIDSRAEDFIVGADALAPAGANLVTASGKLINPRTPSVIRTYDATNPVSPDPTTRGRIAADVAHDVVTVLASPN